MLNLKYLDFTPMIDMQYDLTKRYVARINVIIYNGVKRPVESQRFSKMFSIHRKTTMKDLYHETAALPTLMQGRTLDKDYSTIIFGIQDNRLEK